MDPQYRILHEAIQEIAELCQQRLNKGPDNGDQTTLNICRRALSRAATASQPHPQYPRYPPWTGPQWNGYMMTGWHVEPSPSISSAETKKPRNSRDAARPCPKPRIARR